MEYRCTSTGMLSEGIGVRIKWRAALCCESSGVVSSNLRLKQPAQRLTNDRKVS